MVVFNTFRLRDAYCLANFLIDAIVTKCYICCRTESQYPAELFS